MSVGFPMRRKRSRVCLAAILVLVAALFNPDGSFAKTLTKVKIGLRKGDSSIASGSYDAYLGSMSLEGLAPEPFMEAVIEQRFRLLKLRRRCRSAKWPISESSEKFSPSRARDDEPVAI
jgi:hypothetical protein